MSEQPMCDQAVVASLDKMDESYLWSWSWADSLDKISRLDGHCIFLAVISPGTEQVSSLRQVRWEVITRSEPASYHLSSGIRDSHSPALVSVGNVRPVLLCMVNIYCHYRIMLGISPISSIRSITALYLGNEVLAFGHMLTCGNTTNTTVINIHNTYSLTLMQ